LGILQRLPLSTVTIGTTLKNTRTYPKTGFTGVKQENRKTGKGSPARTDAVGGLISCFSVFLLNPSLPAVLE
jgi:hypothetical protein